MLADTRMLSNSLKGYLKFVQLNFQLNQNPRKQHANFFTMQNYDTGKNILINRFSRLNNKIYKSWLELSLDSIKIKYKTLFLQNH